MPAYPLRAIVLRKTKLGEADTIVTLLAEDGRQVRAVVKGARKTLSRLGARLEPFTVADLLLHTGRSLEIVSEARAVATHDGLRSDFDRTAAASVVADVANRVSVEGQAEQRLYALCVASLDALEEVEVAAIDAVVAAFLVKAVAIQGLRPELVSCAACASALAPGTRFAPQLGGAICPSCGAETPGTLALSVDARDLLLALLRAKLVDVPALGAPPALVHDVFSLLRAFYAHHVPGRLKALEFFVVRPRP